MLLGLKLFSNSKVLFFNCLFYIFDVSNDPSLYIMKKEKKALCFLKNMLKLC